MILIPKRNLTKIKLKNLISKRILKIVVYGLNSNCLWTLGHFPLAGKPTHWLENRDLCTWHFIDIVVINSTMNT